jgi:uncharacterized membrane protein YphA (DoxX/SURF4 family)
VALQRLFSAFPSGWSGAGLLLLRVATGGAAVVEGIAGSSASPTLTWPWAGGLLMTVAGVCLLAGLVTPVAGVAAALTCFAITFTALRSSATPLLCVTAVAVALLGPGAYSIDARLFGRREVVIPLTPERGPDD